MNDNSVKSEIELYYSATPSTIRVLCEMWLILDRQNLSSFLHGAFMFLPWPKEYTDVQKELDFLAKIARFR